MEPIDIIAEVNVSGKSLVIFYDKSLSGLYQYFHNDIDMKVAINEHSEEIAQYAFIRDKDNKYLLNIASTEDFGNFDWHGEWSKKLLSKLLSIYSPLIQKFIVDVTTNSSEGSLK